MSKTLLLLLFATAVICQAAAANETGNATKGIEPEAEAVSAEAKEARKIGIFLLGGVAFLVVIFYLVNAASDIASHTWGMISTTISIFTAVMTFTLVNDLLKHLFGLEPVEAPMLSTYKNVWNSVLQLCTWWVLTCVVLIFQRASPIRLKGYGTIFGHILGFSAIKLYEHVANLEGFQGKPSMTLAVIGIYCVTVPIIMFPTRFLAVIAAKMSPKMESEGDELHVQCKDTGSDFFAMGLSFLICLYVRGIISDKDEAANVASAVDHDVVAAGPEAASRRLSGSGESHDYKDVRALVLAGIGFIILGTLIIIAHHKVAALKKMSMDVVSTTVALSGAWCLLNAANWHYAHKYAGETDQGIAVAIFFSVFFVLAVFTVHFAIKVFGAQKRLMRSFFTATSLAVGLSWEHLFDGALESVGESAGTKEGGQYLHIFATLALILIVTPAWMVYILPQHDAELIKLKQDRQALAAESGSELGPLPMWACCCGDYEIIDDE